VVTLGPDANPTDLQQSLRSTIEELRSVGEATALRVLEAAARRQPQIDASDKRSVTLSREDWDFVLRVAHRAERKDAELRDTQAAALIHSAVAVIERALGYDTVEVLSGEAAGGLTWSVEVSGVGEEMRAMLEVYRNGEWLYGGGGSAKPHGSSLMSCSCGGGGEEPIYDVLVGVDPSVDRVLVRTDRGSEIVLKLSEPWERFGVRFGAVLLPNGEKPADIRAEVGGRTVETFSTAGFDERQRPGPDALLR
jgi:hypothetical protein